MDKFVGQLIDAIEQRGEPTVLVFYGDHLPTLGLEAKDLKGKYLYNTNYVIWDNIGLEKKDGNIAAYQIMAEVFDRLDIHTGTIFNYPLDGTTNFIKRLPHFAVSIAVRIKGRTEVAVVYDPMRNELFTATRGQGAQLNGYRLRGSTARDLDGTIIATGFPFKAKQHAASYMKILGKMFTECADFRRTGSAALDLAYVAAARVDGYFEIGLKPWDFAAGELIAREAGALVCDFTGGHNYLATGNIVAGNPRVVKAMLANMRDELSDALKR